MLVRHILVELSSIAASLAGFVEYRDGPDVDDAQLVLAGAAQRLVNLAAVHPGTLAPHGTPDAHVIRP